MANISREDDKKDFEERRKNNWNRPGIDRPHVPTQLESIKWQRRLWRLHHKKK